MKKFLAMVTTNLTTGAFGEIKAGKEGYKKTLNGWIREKDASGNIFFVDNDEILHIFEPGEVDSWKEKEFSPLPADCAWVGGVVFKKGKEVELKK